MDRKYTHRVILSKDNEVEIVELPFDGNPHDSTTHAPAPKASNLFLCKCFPKCQKWCQSLQCRQKPETSSEDDSYDGQWKDGKMEGYGKKVWKSGGSYDGQWKDGKMEGTGKYVWKSGDSYNGLLKDGKKEGTGKYVWANGDEYNGQWKDDKMEGFGKKVWANGDSYDGQWKDDKMEAGKYVWANGDSYTSTNMSKYILLHENEIFSVNR